MKKPLISLLAGSVAGILDVAPMAAQKLNFYADLSAFVFWLVMGILISYTVMPLKGWLKGSVVAEISSLPVAIIVFSNDRKSVIIILAMSALLGAFVGYLTEKYAK